MVVSEKELLHIANLANINIAEEEKAEYLKNLDDILKYTEVINKAPVENVDETIGANDNYNVFRKDEVVEFDNKEAIMSNAPAAERNMYKIPKVIE